MIHEEDVGEGLRIPSRGLGDAIWFYPLRAAKTNADDFEREGPKGH